MRRFQKEQAAVTATATGWKIMVVDWDDFFRWLSSAEGQGSVQACDEVSDALEKASVDLAARKIIWEDGVPLSIVETARRIHEQAGLPLETIESLVIGWLEMVYEPKGLDEQQMEEFENRIEKWLEHDSEDTADR